MATDPVCKMEVDETKTNLKVEYQGETYYFCAEYCQRRFQENPEKYLKKPAT